MNTTKSWFQKARAQTLKSGKNDNNRNPTASMSSEGNSPSITNASASSYQTLPPTFEKTPTQYLYKAASVRGLPSMMPDVVNVYNLDWHELKPFLEKRYPGVPFKDQEGVEDHYLIYVPSLLTQADRDEIQDIRKAYRDRARSKAKNPGGSGRNRQEHSPDGPRRSLEADDD
ncbi:Uu.00g135700.m01.CDS01 [Anthostomella pinea]|uniref:Uu.00g135700.m01.CDS01 n=1 Tax=Anthostomella pinea TaxID=933095 RepID=A0AAI8VIR4_9PEZI|nr:Uu.00g135700.m01.CDS01 [Anthostomella pinea]